MLSVVKKRSIILNTWGKCRSQPQTIYTLNPSEHYNSNKPWFYERLICIREKFDVPLWCIPKQTQIDTGSLHIGPAEEKKSMLKRKSNKANTPGQTRPIVCLTSVFNVYCLYLSQSLHFLLAHIYKILLVTK